MSRRFEVVCDHRHRSPTPPCRVSAGFYPSAAEAEAAWLAAGGITTDSGRDLCAVCRWS